MMISFMLRIRATRKFAGKILKKYRNLKILAESDEAGIYIVGTTDDRQLFVTGHSEYDPLHFEKRI